jgi:hypothetical protein
MREDFNWPPDSRVSVLSLETGAQQELDVVSPRRWPDVAAAHYEDQPPDRQRRWWPFAATATILVVSVSAGVWWSGHIVMPAVAPPASVPYAPPPAAPPAAVTRDPPAKVMPAPGTDRRIMITRAPRAIAPPTKTRTVASPVSERADTSVKPPVDDARRGFDRPQLPPAENDAPAGATEDPFRIYSGADPGVTAPVLLSRGFVAARATGLGLSRTSRIELVVSDTGAVERVKLLAPSRTMKDAILLSRAKQFEFTPATKDAIQVRYRIVLQVEEGP